VSRVRVENSFAAETIETNTLGVQRSRSRVSTRRYIVQIGLLAASYYFAARLGFILELPRTNISPVWPPSGIGLAAMLLFGRRLWPGIAIGAFLANQLTLPNTLVGFLAASVICVGNTLEHIVAIQLVRRFVPHSSPFDRVRDVFWFVVTACVACTVASTCGSIVLLVTGVIRAEIFGLAWFTWWLGDTAGMLVLTPAIYCWWQTPRLGLSGTRRLELAVLVIATVLAAELLFGGWIASEIISSLPYLVVPSLLWAAIRFGLRETSTLAVLLSVIAVGYVWWWTGGPAVRDGSATVFAPFLVPAFSPNNSLLALQVFVCAVAVTAVTLAAAVNERRTAEAALRQGEERLLLAQQAAHIGTFEWNIQTDVNTWTPEMELMHGLQPGEFGKTQQDWQRLLHPDDLAPTLRCVEQSFHTGMPTEAEWRIIWPDGSVRWIGARFQVFKDVAGKPLRLTH
jgi:integral membrane sensor domain MASE1